MRDSLFHENKAFIAEEVEWMDLKSCLKGPNSSAHSDLYIRKSFTLKFWLV